jgi:putative heme-binding domain-containing protein
VQTSTPLEKQGRIFAVSIILSRGTGDAKRGHQFFVKTCANCHKLHGEGNNVGPDLTGAERKNRELLIRNVVDPSSMIREQYLTHIASTTDGRVMTGLLAESTAETITLLDAQNKRATLNRADLDELQESPVSLMPEKLLDELNDQQLRDLFAYIQSDPAKP